MSNNMLNKCTALLVIDMQRGFLNEKSSHVISSVRRLIDEMKDRKIPVLFTRFHNDEGSQYERLIGWTRLRQAPETDIIPELADDAVTVIDKTQYSAFTPDLTELISKNGWQRLVICGVATDGCVLKTSVDAFERGLVPIVVSDACASHAGEEVHKAGLLLISRFIGKQQVVDTETLLTRD